MASNANLIRQIKVAWRDSEYDESIDAELYAESGHPESDETRRNFRGKLWHEIPRDVLTAQCPGPFLLPKKALCYYLLAFLIVAIEHPDEGHGDSMLVSFILKPPKKPEKLKAFCEKFDCLTSEQRAAVVAFLTAVKSKLRSPGSRIPRQIDEAIESYWGRRDSF